MHATALKLPPAAPPWEKPTSVIRVLRRPRPKTKRGPGAAVSKPSSKWTVLVAFILAIVLHLAPVMILEMTPDRPAVETTLALDNSTTPASVD
jgi:hypothetical protein